MASKTITGNFPKLKELAGNGATLNSGMLAELDERFGGDKLRVFQTKSEFDAREAYGELKSKRDDYFDKREEHLLNLGKGVNAIAKFAFNKAFEGDKSHAVQTSKQVFEVADKIFEVAEKYR